MTANTIDIETMELIGHIGATGGLFAAVKALIAGGYAADKTGAERIAALKTAANFCIDFVS